MNTMIIIARHGNTFRSDEIPRRVGKYSDLPLVETAKGTKIGSYLSEHDMIPDTVFAAPLKRTMETASLAIAAMGGNIPLIPVDDFTEVDYGPDENQTEEAVYERLGNYFIKETGSRGRAFSRDQILEQGKMIVQQWDRDAVVPPGWKVDTDSIINSWINFSEMILKNYAGKKVLVVSSNGIIRFAPYITGDFHGFAQEHAIKVATGALCIFEQELGHNWECKAWNVKP